ncbi:hypothetical protein [Streptomyces pratensis]|uniref:hypothetical protein n=1 Tax=Streptomyces pratensis TaxID=1169025 RepID=UPI00301A6CDB
MRRCDNRLNPPVRLANGRGYFFHCDFFNAWEERTLKAMVEPPRRPTVLRARADRGAALPGWRTLTVRAVGSPRPPEDR